MAEREKVKRVGEDLRGVGREESSVRGRFCGLGRNVVILVSGVLEGVVPETVVEAASTQGCKGGALDCSNCAFRLPVHGAAVRNCLGQGRALALKELSERTAVEFARAVTVISARGAVDGKLDGLNGMEERCVGGGLRGNKE